MAVTRKSYIFGQSPDQFIMVLPVAFDDIASACGASELTGAAPAGVDKLSLKQVLTSGKGFHVRISYLNGTKRKTAKVICDRNHIGGALGLVGKKYKTFDILGATIPQHLTFG
ncbi:hypothetical protein [Nostoc sp. C117]|uniref:hypothetical protein n=1 Tax=Nostoc sp. C117 TaxID=3349875 RepID=UPI00370D952B